MGDAIVPSLRRRDWTVDDRELPPAEREEGHNLALTSYRCCRYFQLPTDGRISQVSSVRASQHSCELTCKQHILVGKLNFYISTLFLKRTRPTYHLQTAERRKPPAGRAFVRA